MPTLLHLSVRPKREVFPSHGGGNSLPSRAPALEDAVCILSPSFLTRESTTRATCHPPCPTAQIHGKAWANTGERLFSTDCLSIRLCHKRWGGSLPSIEKLCLVNAADRNPRYLTCATPFLMTCLSAPLPCTLVVPRQARRGEMEAGVLLIARSWVCAPSISSAGRSLSGTRTLHRHSLLERRSPSPPYAYSPPYIHSMKSICLVSLLFAGAAAFQMRE